MSTTSLLLIFIGVTLMTAAFLLRYDVFGDRSNRR